MKMSSQIDLARIKKELREKANPDKAKFFAAYFKTGKGEYGDGDVFLGVTVPQERAIAKRYGDLPLALVEGLLHSRVHEERAVALIILEDQFKKEGAQARKERRKIYRLYTRNLRYVNNWDLIDFSAPNILGAYFDGKPKKFLYTLARSKDLWERRIAMLATHHYSKQNDFVDALAIAEILIHDKHDLIHKAVGWMLREVGNRSRSAEEKFLKAHYETMPRTMLRYAIEKFPRERREAYLKGHV